MSLKTHSNNNVNDSQVSSKRQSSHLFLLLQQWDIYTELETEKLGEYPVRVLKPHFCCSRVFNSVCLYDHHYWLQIIYLILLWFSNFETRKRIQKAKMNAIIIIHNG